MPKPSSDWLLEDIRFFADIGIDHIVSLLEKSEEIELGLTTEGMICADNQLRFTSFPIADRRTPNLRQFSALVRTLAKSVESGDNLAVHCRAGIGSSGVLVCCIMSDLGHTPEQAIEAVSAARGVPVPDTPDQIEFIRSYSDRSIAD